MSSQSLGLIIGGLIPAVLFGISGLFVKSSQHIGIGLGPYMITMGLSVTLVGIFLFFFVPDRTLSIPSALHTFGSGVSWGVGAALMALAIAKYGVPLGKLVPLYNMNTLITVLLALWIFAEWKEVNTLKLLAGSLLIVIGGTLVARA